MGRREWTAGDWPLPGLPVGTAGLAVFRTVHVMATPPEPVPMATRASVERRIVTVLFADLVGFTPLSERLDAEEVAAVQDAYFAAVRETVERYGGVLEKFIGDAAMAVFGAPHGRQDDAERAVRAGLALIAAIEQLGARLGLATGDLQLRVGVNSGEVVHATDGPDAGRVTGDTVNTAARLQAAARPNAVLVGPQAELTADHLKEKFDRLEPKNARRACPGNDADLVQCVLAIQIAQRRTLDHVRIEE